MATSGFLPGVQLEASIDSKNLRWYQATSVLCQMSSDQMLEWQLTTLDSLIMSCIYFSSIMYIFHVLNILSRMTFKRRVPL